MTATLLDGNSTPTLWVDRQGFNSGRLASYLEVRKSCRDKEDSNLQETTGTRGIVWQPQSYPLAGQRHQSLLQMRACD